jgi:Rhs element Vgr protein
MANERIIPSNQPKSVATFTLFSEGNALPRTYHVLSISITKEINRIPSAIIMLLDGEPSRQSFVISNKTDFAPGKEIEIKAGYRSDEETLFKGIVIKHAIKVRNAGSVLIVECKDKAVKMTVACKSRYFSDIKDSGIIEELIDAHGLEKEVTATTVQHKHIVQYNATDWDMAMCRAEVNGLLCMVNDGKVTLAKPEFSAAPALTIQYGATVHELDAEIDSRLQYKTVKGTTWNYTDQEISDSTEAANANVPETGNLSADTLAQVMDEDEFRLFHSAKMEDPEMQAWVDAALLKHRLAKVRGRVSIDGTAVVQPGKLIQLNGVGERFEGKLYVTGVHHTIAKGDWETVLQFGVNPEWFMQSFPVSQPLAGALLPPIQGLHIGVVTKLAEDPDGEERIKVRVPVIHHEDEGCWSRLATLDAGKERGTFFRPEIGDEVILGFINSDPRHAVVLGMLHSSKNNAPEPLSDDNHKKGYISREKMKLVFDDENKNITIETPGGNKVLMSEEDEKIHLEDQSGNKITMNADGVTIESIKDIILKASGDVKTEGVNLEMKGSGDWKAEGANLEIKGSSATKITGPGTSELSLSGTAALKGAVVNIN